jgi:hypothetical protein
MMIEIGANGKLYVVDYFMPIGNRDKRRTILLVVPEEDNSYINVKVSPADVVTNNTWKFIRARNNTGDIRWEFIGDVEEYGKVIKFFINYYNKGRG